ncbi:tetratricopeptide repeat protein [Burkholderia sp. 22PA0106]|uniref:tetratricopeptide repeat protein n=1 Tax=Burkholderia sp. 22PA0106 TaxID=3237371 RepID=UPI0039C3DDC2
MAADRPRIAPPWLVLLLAAGAVAILYTAWPREALRERIASTAGPSELGVAYQEAWLRVQPDNVELLKTLGEQYEQLGRREDAERIAMRMDAQPDARLHRAATLLRLNVDEQQAFAFPPGDPRRASAIASLRARLAAVAGDAWDTDELIVLARNAAALDLPALAAQFYERLVRQDAPNRRRWNAEVAKYGLWGGDYRRAAAAWFSLQADATTRAEQRRCFIAGVAALRAGNHLNEALAAAQAHLGGLADDRDTLIVLLNLARAAQRPDLVDQYAKTLLGLSGQQVGRADVGRIERAALRVASMQATTSRRTHAAAFLYMDGPVGEGWPRARRIATRAGEVRIVRVAATTGQAPADGGAATAPAASRASDDLPSLLYQSFLESNDLANAQKVATDQVAKTPHSALWLKRLAQVAEWNNAPLLALHTWLGYAQASNDPSGWSNVLRLAPMLHDDASYVVALVHASDAAPNDMRLVDTTTATFERLGRPEDALAFLHARLRTAGSHALDERMALLAERAGHDDEALGIWRKLQQAEPGNTSYALHGASILYRQGQYAPALAMLQAAQPGAADADTQFWRNEAQLARLLQQDGIADAAYRHLLASGVATPDDLSAMTYFYDPYPLDAGRTSQLQFERDHTMRALQEAIYYYTLARAMDRVDALLKSLSPEDRARAEQSPGVLGARAEFYRETGAPLAALADLRRAVDLPGATDDVRAALIWTLVDYGSDAELRNMMVAWRSRALQDSALWGPFAAAEMRMNRPAAALDLLRRQGASMSRDPLWLLTLAEAHEDAGDPDLAWSIRRKVWLQMAQDVKAETAGGGAARALRARRAGQDPERRDELRGRRVLLADIFENGDAAAALLGQLLKDDGGADTMAATRRTLLGDTPGLPPEPASHALDQAAAARLRSAVAIDVAIASALSHDASPLATRWLARQYASRLARPADSQLTLALAEGDTATMQRLVDQRGSRLPIDGRIDALLALDRPGEAEQLAFDGLAGAPRNALLHERLVDTAMAWPQSLSTGVESQVEHPLDTVEHRIGGSVKIGDNLMVGVTALERFQRSADQTQLVNVPGVDRSVDVHLRRQTRNTAVQLTLGRREGLDSFNTVSVSGELGRNSPVGLTGSIGRNQRATESQLLSVGGMKDNLIGGARWTLSQRLLVTGSVEADRFYSQARNFLGSGVLTSGEIEYKLRLDYPDFTLRLSGARGRYSATGTADPLLARLSPAALGPLTAAGAMPPTYAQYGLSFGFGTDLLDRYTHRWRPFLDIGIVHDSVQGWGPQITAGAAGSVFGGDHAVFYLERESVSQAGSEPVTVIGGRYSWFY